LPLAQQLHTEILFADDATFNRDTEFTILVNRQSPRIHEYTFSELFFGKYSVRRYWKPSQWAVCTWRPFDIRALPPFPGRGAVSVVTTCSSL